ncbi:MAG TPA: hypothetical protein VK151_03935 [Fluviicola sp.]|nr:hypothetical protein [Fluviicola sp.]
MKKTIFAINNSMITTENITVERSLLYSLRVAAEKTEILVYVLHGYGQLSRYFLRKIETVLPGTVTFVAPEGMHRFYLQGNSGRVGASWMTKEARETDIIENTAALDRLHRKLMAEFQPEKVLVIGFSQGGATATRWVANGAVQPDGFVSWASVFPPDISSIADEKMDASMKKWFVLGTEDPYFDVNSAEAACNEYRAKQFEVIRFDGQHDLNETLVEQLILHV